MIQHDILTMETIILSSIVAYFAPVDHVEG